MYPFELLNAPFFPPHSFPPVPIPDAFFGINRKLLVNNFLSTNITPLLLISVVPMLILLMLMLMHEHELIKMGAAPRFDDTAPFMLQFNEG